jgi:hypothetical protein
MDQSCGRQISINIIIIISSRVVVVVPGVDEIIVLAANLNKK